MDDNSSNGCSQRELQARNNRSSFSADTVKQAARGRETEVLEFVAGIPRDILDGSIDIRDVPNWMLAKITSGGDKLPFNIDGAVSGSTYAHDFTEYTQAVAARERFGSRFPYLAFCFTKDSRLVFIDLDDCIDSDGNLKGWAIPIVKRFRGCFVELSASGTGLHIVAAGEKPAGLACKTPVGDGLVEIYDSGRFMMVTEDFSGAAAEYSSGDYRCLPMQDAIDWLAETYFTKVEPRQADTQFVYRVEASGDSRIELLRRARSYLDEIGPLPERSRNTGIFKAAGHLFAMECEGERLSLDDVTSLALEWNSTFDKSLPPREVRRAVRNAETKGTPRQPKPAVSATGSDFKVDFSIWPGVKGGDGELTVTAATPANDASPAALIIDSNRPEFSFEELRPLPRLLSPVDPFNFDLLPLKLRGFVRDVADRMQCPPDIPAVSLVVCLASVVGRQITIRPKERDDWTVVPNLWALVVGRPGIMKTPAMEESLKFVRRLEVQWGDDFDKAAGDFEINAKLNAMQTKATEERVRKLLKSGNRDAAVALMRTSGCDECKTPVRRRCIVTNPTVEKLGEILNQNPNGVLLWRDEIHSFLRSLDKDGHEDSRGFYLEAWNGTGRYVFDRIGRGTVDIEACCVSMLGAIQPGRMQDYVRTALRGGAGDDGLLQRFQLLVWPDVPSGEWENVDRWPDSQFRDGVWELFQRLSDIDYLRLGADHDGYGLPYVRFDSEAQALFNEWRCGLERRLRSDALHPAIESHLAKYRSLMPSLALIFSLVDDPGRTVTAESARRAISWCQYLESHAERAYGMAAGEGVAAAHEFARHIAAGDIEDGFSCRDVCRRSWAGFSKADDVQPGLDVLVDCGWLAAVEVQKTRRTWVAYAINEDVVSDPSCVGCSSPGSDQTTTQSGTASVTSVGY